MYINVRTNQVFSARLLSSDPVSPTTIFSETISCSFSLQKVLCLKGNICYFLGRFLLIFLRDQSFGSPLFRSLLYILLSFLKDWLLFVLSSRLDFQNFVLAAPEALNNRCTNDQFIVTGANSPIPTLCGVLTGQHGKHLSS